MTYDEIKSFFADNIAYKDWVFHVKLKKPEGLHECCTEAKGTIYLQIQFDAIDGSDSLLGAGKTRQNCRKWQLSTHMTPTELVRTAWKAVQAAVEHEAAEQFTFRGCAIYNPHIDVEVLREASMVRHDVRR